MSMSISLSVIGSVNLDIVATGEALPSPGETVTGATLERHPGGKGANMALAARRLGADVSLIARVGEDAFAGEALALLKESGADLSEVRTLSEAPTGVALIAVSQDGENQIIVASGANEKLLPGDIPPLNSDAVLCVLEVPAETIVAAGEKTSGFFAVNLAPALPVPDAFIARANLIIVNEGEAEFYGRQLETAAGIVAITYGGKGAALFAGGEKIAQASPPVVDVVDTTGAGDTFSAALTVALSEGKDPEMALQFAIAASAHAVTKAGAQPSLPLRADVDEFLDR